jgi:hypothetical protein
MSHLPPAHHETSKRDSPHEIKVKKKQNYPVFKFKHHQVNDSSQSNKGIDHLVSQKHDQDCFGFLLEMLIGLFLSVKSGKGLYLLFSI